MSGKKNSFETLREKFMDDCTTHNALIRNPRVGDVSVTMITRINRNQSRLFCSPERIVLKRKKLSLRKCWQKTFLEIGGLVVLNIFFKLDFVKLFRPVDTPPPV